MYLVKHFAMANLIQIPYISDPMGDIYEIEVAPNERNFRRRSFPLFDPQAKYLQI